MERWLSGPKQQVANLCPCKSGPWVQIPPSPFLKVNNMPKPKMEIKYSFIKVLTGSDLSSRRLAFACLKSQVSGPAVWLTAGVHGDEVGGIVIVQEVFKRLRREGLSRGAVYTFPLMNPIGFESGVRGMVISEEDLNRSFPGNQSGNFAERIAQTIFKQITATNPALVLDLHNDWSNSIPYALIDPYPGLKYRTAYEKMKQFSEESGFAVINEEEENLTEKEELKKTLTGSLLLHDIPALTLEVGGAYLVKEEHVAEGVKSVFNLLSYLGLVSPVKEKFAYPLPESLKGKVLRYSHRPLCSKSGIIRFMIKPGQIVKPGQPIARVYNVFGKLVETLTAVSEALVLGHSDSAVALPGRPVVAFGLIK